MSKIIGIRVPEEVKEHLEFIAKKKNIDLSTMLKKDIFKKYGINYVPAIPEKYITEKGWNRQ